MNSLYFRATDTDDHHILIEWETAVEQNVVAFCVQRSLLSGGGFLRIADCQPSKGYLLEGARYSLIDIDVVQGTRYYHGLEVVGSDHIPRLSRLPLHMCPTPTELTCL